jgi:GntR family transcriptional regulator/MocR family aminotransferase
MAETWANSLDLHVELSGSRMRSRLEAALRDAIRSGRLADGARLPSSRALAADLGVARNTVADAYTQLAADGWLTARIGAGTTVAPRSAVAAVPGPDAAAEVPRPRYDLRPGEPTCPRSPAASG